jgi:hypothetical protein
VESLIAQASRLCDLHQARYRGLAKTHLQHVLTALAINLVRVDAWLTRVATPEAGPPDSPGWPNPSQHLNSPAESNPGAIHSSPARERAEASAASSGR